MTSRSPIRIAASIAANSLRRVPLRVAGGAILFLFGNILPLAAIQAQGCGGMSHGGGSHGATHTEHTASMGIAPIWSNILSSRLGLIRAVDEMSVPDTKHFGGLLRDYFSLLKKNPATSDRTTREALNTSNNRIKQLTEDVEREVKAGASGGALAALRRLDIELQRTTALFPAGSLPPDAVTLQPFPDSTETVGTSDSGPAVYACPMHPDVTSTTPGECPKCGMALARRD